MQIVRSTIGNPELECPGDSCNCNVLYRWIFI